MQNANFRQKIETLMARVSLGRVTTYGDLAAPAGHPYVSRVVGGIAHNGNSDLLWHRLVNRFGGLGSGFHGGREAQAQLLKQENISCTNYIINQFEEKRWQPHLS